MQLKRQFVRQFKRCKWFLRHSGGCFLREMHKAVQDTLLESTGCSGYNFFGEYKMFGIRLERFQEAVYETVLRPKKG